MIKKVTALVMVLLLLTMGTAACGAGENRDTSGSSQAVMPESMDAEQLEREIQKMKDEGILDENGQPAPGVDLNDYPGLG